MVCCTVLGISSGFFFFPNMCFLLPKGVFCLKFADLRPLILRCYEMAQDHFQRLSVSLIHSKKEERQHDDDHSHGCQRHVSGLFQKKKERQSDKDRSSETEDLAFGEV